MRVMKLNLVLAAFSLLAATVVMLAGGPPDDEGDDDSEEFENEDYLWDLGGES